MAAVIGWSKTFGIKLHAEANLLSCVASISLAVDSTADWRSLVALEFLFALSTSSKPGFSVALLNDLWVVPWLSVSSVIEAKRIS